MNGLFLLAYLSVQVLIGLWISKKIHSENDYFLGGRKLPLLMVALSLFATWFGAETCIGSSAAVYQSGLWGSRAEPFGYTLCLLLMGLLLAARLRQGKYVTLADYYRERYGPFIEKFAIVVLVPSSLIWAAAQLRAFGQVIAATTTMHVTLAITLSAAFVLLYTYLGGLLGDIYTDLIQGAIVAVGLILLLAIVLGDFSGIREVFASMDPSRLSFIAPNESILERMDRWMVPVLGSLVAQEAISRLLAARSVSIARNASFVACGVYFALGAIPVFLGLAGPSLLPAVADPEQFLVKLAGNYLPPALFIVFAGALISAILATIDSILLAISALCSHNIIVPAFRIKSESGRILSARIVVLSAGGAAYVIALYAKGVYHLVVTASAFGTAGVLVITLLGFYTKIRSQAAAATALIAGLVLTVLGEYVLHFKAPFITAVLGSGGIFFISAVLEKKISSIPGWWLSFSERKNR
ncbi:MAG: sodium:solute symporter [Candidatus Aminicenantes bacterium]|nr:sodium:solute symporter [Candidatus Aminicenantes bacterium]